MKLRGGRAQIRTHRPQGPQFRVTYSCESEHWENVSDCFTKKCSCQNVDVVLWLRLQDIKQKSCLQWKMLTLLLTLINKVIMLEMAEKCSNYAKNWSLCFSFWIMLCEADYAKNYASILYQCLTCGRVFQHNFISKANLKNPEQGFLVHRFYLLRKQKDCLWQGRFST